MVKKHGKEKSGALMSKIFVAALAIIFVLVLSPGLFEIDGSQALGSELSIRLFKPNSSQAPTAGCAEPRLCTRTANAAFTACQFEARDDYWIAIGNCNNLSDPNARAECFMEAWVEFWEAREECRDQREARLDICEELGEGPYDPELDPNDFVDPSTIIEATANPYFPLVPGTKWVYETRDIDDNLLERITVTVTGDIKEIEYPSDSSQTFKCAVVNDVVEEFIGEPGDDPTDDNNYIVIEDTDDWYAQKTNGDVWYFGEIAQEFEDGELVSLEGSWKPGVDGAKPGILMLADPQEGDYYRQEFFLGDAEDMGEVVGFIGSINVRGKDYYNVVKTRDFTPLEPDVEEFKYYARDVGLVLEENPESGERVELVNMTTP